MESFIIWPKIVGLIGGLNIPINGTLKKTNPNRHGIVHRKYQDWLLEPGMDVEDIEQILMMQGT